VAELSQEAQIRLLRVLQDKTVERVGGKEPMKLDIRVVAATHKDLGAMVRQGLLREDLFFRLNVFPITIPISVLHMTGGRIEGGQGAADLLGINPRTLRSRMEKLGIPFGRRAQLLYKNN